MKRVFDILFSLMMILLCFAFLWWWVTIINLFATKGHPFFAPKRIGKHKKVFRMLKFRSMKIDAPVIPPYEITDEQMKTYETGFGRFLRKSSIDETLQFINVFIGHMSIVGPRPGAEKDEEILIQARESFTPSAFEVKPGITGYAQVYMKREHDVNTKASFDSEYVKKMSVGLDFKILISTLLLTFRGK